jgi:hypothetical protein
LLLFGSICFYLLMPVFSVWAVGQVPECVFAR